MTDSEQFTLYDNETQQSMTVTVNDLDESSSGIQYLNQDGTPVSVSQLAHTDIVSQGHHVAQNGRLPICNVG